MRFFRPEVERFIKILSSAAMIGAFVVPLGWGYHQREEARAWRETVCAYRLRDIARGLDLVRTVRPGEDSCAALRRLGLDAEPSASISAAPVDR